MRATAQEDRLWCAVVWAADGVRLAALGRSRRALLRTVAGYVEDRLAVELPPGVAEEIRSRLDAGDIDGALHEYFAPGRHQWDEECLHLVSVAEPAAVV